MNRREADNIAAERDRYHAALRQIAHAEIVTEEIGRYPAPQNGVMVRRLTAQQIAKKALAAGRVDSQ